MIIYDETKNTPEEFDSIIEKEIILIDKLQQSQDSLKNNIIKYESEISTTFENDEIFKNMLLASLKTAKHQIAINLQDLTNLLNILDIILSNKTSLLENIEQYNKLFTNVEKNIKIVEEIFEKTVNSFEYLSSITPPKEINKVDTKKSDITPSPAIENDEKTIQEKNITRNIKEIGENDSSDFLCFFPKTDNDILAISTVQDTYKVTFHEDMTTVCIEEENFNFTLKTVGVQISNSENVLLISRETPGYFIITNIPIEVPSYINVSRIERNKNFIEIGISNSSLSISVTQNKLTFLDEFEETTVKENDEILAVSPSTDEPLPELAEQPPISEPENDDEIDFSKDNNTLIISEEDNQIILPYKFEEVEKQYQKNKKRYSSVQELIENEYILPKENFKNPIKSRFREAYHLIKKKEHGHLKEALELGFELMFQSNLNPAVIAACKNLKELDIYLDCLDENELDKFSCFNIVYQVPPTIGRKKKK